MAIITDRIIIQMLIVDEMVKDTTLNLIRLVLEVSVAVTDTRDNSRVAMVPAIFTLGVHMTFLKSSLGLKIFLTLVPLVNYLLEDLNCQ